MNGGDATGTGLESQGNMPYSTFMRERPQHEQSQSAGAQTQVLPNGMNVVTLPHDHSGCGLIRCKANHGQKTFLLPPNGYTMPQAAPQGMMMPTLDPMMQSAMMNNFGGMSYMPVAMQQPQMQTVPVTAMTPMGPAVIGYQQVPVMNQMEMMNPMMNQMVVNQMNPMGMTQMNPMGMGVMYQPVSQQETMQPAVARTNPAVATQMSGTIDEAEGELPAPALLGGVAPAPANPMALVATPFGYAIQVPAEAAQQADVQMQIAQMQQALLQSQMQ
jgi:hypothetical protein